MECLERLDAHVIKPSLCLLGRKSNDSKPKGKSSWTVYVPCLVVQLVSQLLSGWPRSTYLHEICRTWNALRGVPCAANNHLRTGADKGNPTV